MSQDITQDILSQAVEEVIAKFGRINLAELERMLPLSQQQLRRLQKSCFKLTPNGNSDSGVSAPIGYKNHVNFEILVHFFGTVRNGNNVIINYTRK